MEQFFTNPGLVHIGEKIFQNLDYQSLEICQNVCQTWKIIIENPEFWINSFVVPKILVHQGNVALENKNSDHETSSAAAATEWKYLIKKTFETSLKSNVLKVLIAQKETEKIIRTPIFMALKVQDLCLIHHLLRIFLKKIQYPSCKMKEKNKARKIIFRKAVNKALESLFNAKNIYGNHMRNKCGENDDEIQQEAQLSKILIEHILQNFPSKSYMDRYTFVYQLELHLSYHGLRLLVDKRQFVRNSFTSEGKP